MSEFKDKVEQYKQTIVDPGFQTENTSGITDIPTINVGDSPVEETPGEIQQDNTEQQTYKKQGRKSVDGLKKRIDQITYERNVMEAKAQELMNRIQEQEQILADQQALLKQNEQYKNAYYENNLHTREKAILSELKFAKEEGDVDKEIALSKELAKVTADQSTYGLYKSQLKNQNISPVNYNSYQDPHTNLYPNPTIRYNEPINEAYDSWLEKNTWADPESSNYSPRLREEANQLANELDEMLRYNGNAEFIGTPAYFDSIDNLMSQMYSVKKNDQDQMPRDSQSYSVAPVSRNGSSMADQYISRNPNNTRQHMSLSEDEYKIARNLQIKLPNGKYATGDEAVRRYAEAKRFQNPQGSQKLVIE